MLELINWQQISFIIKKLSNKCILHNWFCKLDCVKNILMLLKCGSKSNFS